jgi:hypothetical protein
MSFAIQASASNCDLPSAAALHSFFRNFGQMLGISVGGAIFQNEVKRNMLQYPSLANPAAAYSSDASAMVEVIRSMPPAQRVEKGELITAYVDALRILWLIMCLLDAFALCLLSRLRRVSHWKGNWKRSRLF